MQSGESTATLGARRALERILGIAIILAVGAIGLFLRFVDLGRPFPSGDHAEVAAIITFFYPRNLQAFAPGNPFSVWHLIENPHGIAPVLLALAWPSVIGILGIHITEFWWNLPFAILGLGVIPLGYRLGRLLDGRLGGIITALMLTVLPVQATIARASGGASHIAFALLVQLWAVDSMIRYYQNPSPQNQRRASLAFVGAVLTDVLLPILFFMLLAVGVFTAQTEQRTFRAQLQRTRALLFGSQLIRWPLIALAFPVGMIFLQAAGLISYSGLLGRLFGGSGGGPGIKLGDFLNNAMLNIGPLALAVLIVCAIASVPALRRLEPRGLLLAWSALYLAPFIVFSRPYVFDFYLLGMTPLVINAALVGADWLRRPALAARAAGALGMLLLLGLLCARTFTMVYGADLGPVIGSRQAAGAIYPDPGLKAAGWWIRAHTDPKTLVFGDQPYEPYQLAYYLHRPFLAQIDAPTAEEVYQQIAAAPERPAYYLVVPGNEPLLRKYAGDGPQLRASILVDQQPTIQIYGPPGGPAEQIDVEAGNQQFDQQFGGWATMFSIGTSQ